MWPMISQSWPTTVMPHLQKLNPEKSPPHLAQESQHYSTAYRLRSIYHEHHLKSHIQVSFHH
jgi:hypothetical protein